MQVQTGLLAIAYADGTARIYTSSGEQELMTNIIGNTICILYSTSGLLSCHLFYLSHFLALGDLRAVLEQHNKSILAIKWNNKGSYIATASMDKTAIVWDPNTANKRQAFDIHQGWIPSLITANYLHHERVLIQQNSTISYQFYDYVTLC